MTDLAAVPRVRVPDPIAAVALAFHVNASPPPLAGPLLYHPSHSPSHYHSRHH